MFVSVLAALPVYNTYRAKITYTVPWINNTQHADVARDVNSHRVKYAFYNNSDEICDYTVVSETSNKYARTTKDTYECVFTKSMWANADVMFVPDLAPYTQLADTKIHGTPVEHYRYINDYIDRNQPNNLSYTEVRTYQQDFYCQRTEQGCVPLKWYMNSKSNFHSHYDIYIIEYSDFEFTVEEKDFIFYDFNGIAVCNAVPDPDPENPDGPTHRGFINMFKMFSKVNEIKVTSTVQKNLALINEWRQNENFTFKVAPNHMIDMEIEDIIRTKTGKAKFIQLKEEKTPFNDEYFLDTPYMEDLPNNLDWRVKGALTYAKDQLFCGSCWTFSAVGVLESRINIARINAGIKDPLITLSEQSVVDCHWQYKLENGFQTSMGCEGGDEDDVLYNWVGKNKFATDHKYQYLGQNDWCKPELSDFTGYKVKAWHRVPFNSVVQLKRALMSGPVAVGVAVPATFAFYAGGVYNDVRCGSKVTDIGHAVVAVGWGESEFGPYWIIRNSWSPLWGQDGYINIAMKDNLCGVMTIASYIDIEKE
ncbi:Cathepsin_L [Hexamita inflata]|uniref:Cathepsin L n=1 Tax=Hexamita inflata TaxID=28002 RepID=A0AA86V170_9EUKA|nr:Cathepsin L [Hexamita inflata]